MPFTATDRFDYLNTASMSGTGTEPVVNLPAGSEIIVGNKYEMAILSADLEFFKRADEKRRM